MTDISVIIPTRNEEKIILKNLTKIYEYLDQLNGINNFEIIICDRSEDKTPSIIKDFVLKFPEIKYIRVEKKGIGAGLKAGIDQAQYDILMFYDIDMAWTIDIIETVVSELLKGYDIVYGSRYAENSNTNRPWIRKIFSTGYYLLVRILFNIKIRDWNANRACKKYAIMKFRNKLEDDTGFFHTELAIYAKRYNLRMKEIPANVNDLRNSSTEYVLKVAYSVFKSSIRKRIELWLKD